mmetsp:Transcript_54100/g.150069  ORF Transcript_54100/g.150069 Transcript_54100/m.150069 type:complete len:230 (+) Transcript_54100:2096-2785(+)
MPSIVSGASMWRERRFTSCPAAMRHSRWRVGSPGAVGCLLQQWTGWHRPCSWRLVVSCSCRATCGSWAHMMRGHCIAAGGGTTTLWPSGTRASGSGGCKSSQAAAQMERQSSSTHRAMRPLCRREAGQRSQPSRLQQRPCSAQRRSCPRTAVWSLLPSGCHKRGSTGCTVSTCALRRLPKVCLANASSAGLATAQSGISASHGTCLRGRSLLHQQMDTTRPSKSSRTAA